MRISTRTWWLISLVCFIGAAWFWHLGNQRAAQSRPDRREPNTNVAPTSPAPPQAAGPQPLLVTPESLASSSASDPTEVAAPVASLAESNDLRLRNTSLPLAELVHMDEAILLRNALLDSRQPPPVSFPEHLRRKGDPGAYVVQARGAVTESFRHRLRESGAEVVSYIPNNAFLVRADAEAARSLEAWPGIRAVLPWEPYYKFSLSLLGPAVERVQLTPRDRLNVVVFPGREASARQAMEALGITVFNEARNPFGRVFSVAPSPDALTQLALRPEVQAIEPHYLRAPANDLGRTRTRVSVDSEVPDNYLGLTGEGVLVNVNDTGVEGSHPDLTGRVIGPAVTDGNGHGTHVGGIIASSGQNGPSGADVPGSTTNANYRGMAPSSSLYVQPVNLVTGPLSTDEELQEQAALTNALISNNSWTYQGAFEYSFQSASWDAAVRDAVSGVEGSQPLLVVVAAGNVGGGDTGGQGGLAGTIESPANGKNVITVGALENFRNITNEVVTDDQTNMPYLGITDSSNQVAATSSRGNVGIGVEGPDGRFKPDLVAPGTFVVSTRSSTWNVPSQSTRQIVNTRTNRTILPGETNLYNTFVPPEGFQLRIRTLPVGGGTGSLPPLLIHAAAGFPPTSADYRGTNDVTFPAQDDIWFITIGNTNNQTITFDLQTIVTVTNTGGDPSQVLRDLNAPLEPHYRYESGTSMSAPVVSGMLALMQQHFRDTFDVTNSPALMKALLINGARMVSEDYTFQADALINYVGWGLPNLTNSIPLSDNSGAIRWYDQSPSNALVTGASRTQLITLTSNSLNQPLRLTLAWTDPPGNPVSSLKLVNNLDLIVTNLDTMDVYVGNNFGGGSGIFTDPSTTDEGLFPDVVNNVENIYLEPPLSGRYSVTVVARRVNVNAVTAHPDGVAQDYALVISAGRPPEGTPMIVEDPVEVFEVAPRVVAVTNGIPLLNQTSGAHPGTLVSTNGMTNQWSFYVLTNSLTVSTNGPNGETITNGGPYVAFVTFLPPNLSRARASEADIDMYVSTDPAITNLSQVAIETSLRSLDRGGTESVLITNSPDGTIYYVGVKSEDQQSATYGFFSIATSTPFTQSDSNGNVTVTAFPAGVVIPDGTPDMPAVALMFGFATEEVRIKNVVVTNVISHESGGDLIGALSHNMQFAVLNNHRIFQGTQLRFIYDDSDSGEIGQSQVVDGPGSLRDFAGEEGQGSWQLTMVDDSQFGTGRVEFLTITIEPQPEDLTNGVGISSTILPGRWDTYSIDVPVGATNLVACAAPEVGPIELYIRRDAEPTQTAFDVMGTILPPGGCISLTPNDSPPLSPGRYWLGLFNPTAVTANVTNIQFYYELDLNASEALRYRSVSSMRLLDDALTNSVITVNRDQLVHSVEVGVRIAHERVSDLVLHLVSPLGTRLLLAENRGHLDTNGYGGGILMTNKLGTQASGGAMVDSNIVSSTQNEGTILIDYEFFQLDDRMTIYYEGQQILDTGYIDGAGQLQAYFGPGTSTNILIVMNEGNNTNANTMWFYTPTILSGDYIYTAFTENGNKATLPIKFAPLPFAPTNVATLTITNDAVTADFETPAPQFYNPGQVVDGWMVLTNPVEVVNNPGLAYQGDQYLSMVPGIITRVLPTTAGNDYELTFAHRNVCESSWWPANGNSLDAIGTNDAVVLANPPPLYAPGQVGDAWDFYTTNSYLIVPASASMDVGAMGAFTIEGWVNPRDVSRPVPILEWNDGTTNGVGLWIGWPNTGGLLGALVANLWTVYGTNVVIATTSGPLIPNTWYHIALTFDRAAGSADLYLNGVRAVGSFNAGPLDLQTGYDVYFGHRPAGRLAPTTFNGLMDEFSVHACALPPRQIMDLYLAGLAGQPKSASPGGAPAFDLYVGALITNFTSSVAWNRASIPFTAPAGPGTLVTFDASAGALLLDLIQLEEVVESSVFYLPEESIRPFEGENALGDWTLEIWDTRAGGDISGGTLLSWQLEITFISTNVPVTRLTNHVPYMGTIAGDGAACFEVYVPVYASLATNYLTASGPMDLLFNQSAIPMGNVLNGDYFLLTNHVDGGAVIWTNVPNNGGTFEVDAAGVMTNPRPDPKLVRGLRYYLCVRNSNPDETNDFTLQVDFDVGSEFLPDVIPLTNMVAYTNTIQVTNRLDYYYFDVSTNAYQVTFEILGPDGNVDLYARQGLPLPNQNNYQEFSANPGTANEFILLTDGTFTNLTGRWYLGVTNLDVNPVNYTILATEWLLDWVNLTNDLSYGDAVPLGGVRYYRYDVSSRALGLDLVTYLSTGDVDVYVARNLPPLPGPLNFLYNSATPGIGDEYLTITNNAAINPLVPGPWWVAVVNNDPAPLGVGYEILVHEHRSVVPFMATNLDNGIGFSNTVAVVSGQTFRFTVSSNAIEAHFEALAPSSDVDLLVGMGDPALGLTNILCTSTNFGVVNEFIAVAITNTPCLLTPGDWYLLVTNRASVDVDYVVRATEYIPGVTNLALLYNGMALTNRAVAYDAALNLGTDYYQFTVSSNAIELRVELVNAIGNTDLYIRRDLPLPGRTNFDYAAESLGPIDELIVIGTDTNSSPVPLVPGDWYFAVANRDALAHDYVLLVTEVLPSAIIVLTNALPYTNTLAVADGTSMGGVDYYQFEVSTNEAVQVNFETYAAGGNVDLYVGSGLPLPGPALNAGESLHPGLEDEWVLIHTNSLPVMLAPGTWYLMVTNLDAAPVDYVVRASEIDAPDVVELVDGNPLDTQVTLDDGLGETGYRYFSFLVDTNMAQVEFQVFGMDGDVDLYLQEGLPLAHAGVFDAASTNAGLADELLVSYLGSPTTPLTPGWYYLTVRTTSPGTVNFSIRAQAYAIGTSVDGLTSGTATTNSFTALESASPGAIQYFRFIVSTNAVRAQFDLYDMDQNLDMVVRKGLPLPTPGNHDYASTNGMLSDEQVRLYTDSVPVPLTAGDWYVGVINTTTNPATYILTATEFGALGTNFYAVRFFAVSNMFCVTWTNVLPNARYHVLGTPTLTPPAWTAVSSNLTAVTNELTWCLDLPSPYSFFQLVDDISPSGFAGVGPLPVSISGYEAVGGGFRLTWTTAPARRFSVEWATGLPAATWNTFPGVVTSTNRQYEFLDDGSQTGGMAPQRFYRIVEAP